MDTGSLKGEFFKTIKSMINEFDIAFDYIDDTLIKKLQKYFNRLSNEETFFNDEVETIYNILQNYNENLVKIHIEFNGKKIKKTEYAFLSKIVLFKGLLSFSIFEKENKNTKNSLVAYLHTIYMYSLIFYYLNNDNVLDENILNFISLQTKSLGENKIDDESSIPEFLNLQNL